MFLKTIGFERQEVSVGKGMRVQNLAAKSYSMPTPRHVDIVVAPMGKQWVRSAVF